MLYIVMEYATKGEMFGKCKIQCYQIFVDIIL